MNCKLTRQDMTTHDDFKWVVNEWMEATGTGGLCTDGMLHFYEHPLLAVFHNPIHGDYDNPRLWRAEVAGRIERDGQMKAGASRMRIVEEIPLPEITIEQRVRYAIYCAQAVLTSGCPEWRKWADQWLSGHDRSEAAAWAARSDAAARAANAANAANAAWAAARAARAAAWAARSEAARAAEAAGWVRSEAAARAAANAAEAAGWVRSEAAIDLISLAIKAVEDER